MKLILPFKRPETAENIRHRLANRYFGVHGVLPLTLIVNYMSRMRR